MGSGIDRAEDQQERARQRKLAAQKAQAGASNIIDRFGLGDTGSPRRKRGRGMSAAFGVI